MSAELTKARQLISSVGFNLKQKKLVSAANSLFEALGIVLRNPLIKTERDEFGQLIDRAVYLLASDQGVREIYPLVIQYEPGKEKELQETLRDILNALTLDSADKARDMMADLEQRKQDMLAKAQAYLDEGDTAHAKATFDKVIADNPSDVTLMADVADRFLKAVEYSMAFEYLDTALHQDPKAIFLYNRIGMVLRKLKDFATAEKYYTRAMDFCDTDEYLYFNAGRVYIDWQKWPQAVDMAQKALDINPGFEQAQKMLAFAHKKQG